MYRHLCLSKKPTTTRRVSAETRGSVKGVCRQKLFPSILSSFLSHFSLSFSLSDHNESWRCWFQQSDRVLVVGGRNTLKTFIRVRFNFALLAVPSEVKLVIEPSDRVASRCNEEHSSNEGREESHVNALSRENINIVIFVKSSLTRWFLVLSSKRLDSRHSNDLTSAISRKSIELPLPNDSVRRKISIRKLTCRVIT